MRVKIVKWLLFIIITLWMSGCVGTSSSESELTVSVAASVYDAMNDIKSVYEQKTDMTIRLNVGSSGALRKQIEQGAPVDLFISASERHMEQLIQRGLINEENVLPILTNTLVLITPTSMDLGVKEFDDLTDDEVGRIAVAFPESVPAGRYAQETLMQLGLWEKLRDKFVFAKDVRQVLSYVESGNVEAGIVYKSDAERSSKVRIAVEANPLWHAPIVYPTGVVASSDHIQEAEDFMDYLQTAETEAIFMQYGFALWEK